MESPRVIWLLIVASLINATNAGNILCLMGAASESTQLRSRVLFKALASRGHQMTVLGEAEYITKAKFGTDENISYIDITIAGSEVAKDYGTNGSQLFKPYYNMMMWYDREMPICNDILTSEGFETVLEMGKAKRAERPFDLIIYDVVNAPPCLLSLAQAFVPQSPDVREVALVGLNMDAKILPEMFEQARGGIINPASMPHFMSEFNEDMSYYQRFYNLILYILSYVVRHWILRSKITELTNRYLFLRGAEFRLDYESILKRVHLIIINTHPVFNYAQPLPPNVIEVPGWHIEEAKELPSVVLKFIGNSSNGVIFMSLGCHYRIDVATEKKRVQTILAVVKRMPDYVFLWKVKKGKSIRKPPKNLYMSASLSENDVLSYPQTKIYFTDADSLKLQEAMYYGVPVIAAPMLIDQLGNAKRIFERRMGLRIQFDLFREDSFYGAITTILTNYHPFKFHAQLKQVAFRNRPYPPLEIVTWWIEQMLKNHEIYEHLILQTGGKQNFFVQQSWDVLALYTLFFCMWSWSFYAMSSCTLWFMMYGRGRYYSIRLIRLVWDDFMQAELQQQVLLEQLQQQEAEQEEERIYRARARGRGRGRGNRRGWQ